MTAGGQRIGVLRFEVAEDPGAATTADASIDTQAGIPGLRLRWLTARPEGQQETPDMASDKARQQEPPNHEEPAPAEEDAEAEPKDATGQSGETRESDSAADQKGDREGKEEQKKRVEMLKRREMAAAAESAEAKADAEAQVPRISSRCMPPVGVGHHPSVPLCPGTTEDARLEGDRYWPH